MSSVPPPNFRTGLDGTVRAPSAADVSNQRILRADGTWVAQPTASLPSQTGNAGRLITTDGTNASWRDFNEVAPLFGGIVTRRTSDVLISDGATSSRRVEFTPGAPGAVAGLPIVIPFEFDVPSSNPSVTGIGFYGPSATSSTANGLDLQFLRTDGGFLLRQYGATTSDFRAFLFSGFRLAYSGQSVRGMIVFPAGNSTTNPIVYCNGVDISSSFSASTGGTPPNWMPAAMDCTKYALGGSWPSGRFVPHGPILGTLTAAEVLAWTQTGRLPTWCEVGTGNASSPRYTSNFSAGADSWTTDVSFGGSAPTGNIDADADGAGVPPSNDWLRFRRNTGLGTGQLYVYRAPPPWDINRKYRMTGSVFVPVGSPITHLTFARTGGAPSSFAADERFTVAVSPGSVVTFSGEIFSGSGAPQIQVTNASAVAQPVAESNAIYLRDLVLTPLGPLFRPAIRSGRILPDLGGNGIHGTLTAGVVAITEEYRGTVIQRALTANGEFIDATGTVPADAVIESVTVRNTTSNAVSGFALGSASGGDQVTYRTDIPANTTVTLPIKRDDGAFLTAGTYTGQLGTTFSRLYYSALSWNSGSLNVSVRYRRERGI